VYLSLLVCSYFVVLCFVVVLCIFIFVCTSVGLLPPGESPIEVNNNNNNNNNIITQFVDSYLLDRNNYF
jgi:hypothetical protein